MPIPHWIRSINPRRGTLGHRPVLNWSMKEEQGMDEAEYGPTPGDQLRALPGEAHDRGTRFVSAEAMQARLFSVYDAAAAAEEALALVQQQLTLTLQRHYYEADEIEQMADELDSLLMLSELDDDGLVSET